jgi:pyruvate dehydrogenase E1 component
MRRMLDAEENVFYYVTVMNENYAHPPMPAGAEAGILRGMYLLRPATDVGKGDARRGKSKGERKVRLLGSGTILREALGAAEILERDHGVAAEVWSVTSYTELRRDGMEAERWNRLHPDAAPRPSFVAQRLGVDAAPVVAATDYVSAVPDLIRPYVSARYVTLGTDGFGRSDTRASLRRFFEVDAAHIAVAALKALADEGMVSPAEVDREIERHSISADAMPPWRR